jgi:putative transposase
VLVSKPVSYKRHRFLPGVITHAVWLYFRFTLSFRDVEEMLVQRGIDVSYETIRCWTLKFGPKIAPNLKRRRGAPSPRWHLDEMVVKVRRRQMYLWRAVDHEGEVLDMIMQHRRDTTAAHKLPRRLMWSQKMVPETVTTDGLKSYDAALTELVSKNGIDRVGSEKIIEWRTRICPSDDESGRCRASSPKGQHRNS